MKKAFLSGIITIAILSGCGVSTKNSVKKFHEIKSPDASVTVFLEKEYDPNIKRFIRQSVVLENAASKNRIILNEIKLTPEEALVRYTKDGWNKEKTSQCNSLIDFDEFKPIRWIKNEQIEVGQYFDNYECAGAVTKTFIYNTKGEKISEKDGLSEMMKAAAALCNDPPKSTDIGRDVYPIDEKYKQIQFLGQLFTAYSCGPDRMGKIFGVNGKNYTAGSTIWLKENPSAPLIETFKVLGFQCSENADKKSCKQWQLSKTIKIEDLIKLEPFSENFQSDDCTVCG